MNSPSDLDGACPACGHQMKHVQVFGKAERIQYDQCPKCKHVENYGRITVLLR